MDTRIGIIACWYATSYKDDADRIYISAHTADKFDTLLSSLGIPASKGRIVRVTYYYNNPSNDTRYSSIWNIKRYILE
ncbi:hypothetical protein [Mahella australiensis]|uniref:hypothetical protein n=1 Tax=Mahella australiensis TaxID=252966 RepID=UPI0005A2F410|nr:hypothetical protein [Mahella australiensis]